VDPRIAYLATYPPRRCGIASFTQDLRTAVGTGGAVFALGPLEGDLDGPAPIAPEVRAVLRDHEPSDYRRFAVAIDGSGGDVVSIQHEYGIYGGPDGLNLLHLVDRLEAPLVTTFHTVLTNPTDRQRAIVRELGARSEASVVMSDTAARLLAGEYDVDPTRIRTIPHGVPDLPRIDPELRKPGFGLAGRSTILSFGLVGPGKGYELVIEAMAAVRRLVPEALYVVLGATHPELLRREGEAYRDGLRRRVVDLGLEDHVRFEDRFVGRSELGRWLQASNVFVTPYPNLDQIVSGTLSYAIGAGLPVVSTPYLYAREVLAGGRGVLVPAGSVEALADALAGVLGDPAWRAELATRAYAHGRRMTWPRVGLAYRDLFAGVARPTERERSVSRQTEIVHA
jgi:glycosyltransferase involved in cell wall biosynthesis